MSIVKLILAQTEEEEREARQELADANANAPTDWEVVASFVKQCTTLDGKPLALDEQGRIVERND